MSPPPAAVALFNALHPFYLSAPGDKRLLQLFNSNHHFPACRVREGGKDPASLCKSCKTRQEFGKGGGPPHIPSPHGIYIIGSHHFPLPLPAEFGREQPVLKANPIEKKKRERRLQARPTPRTLQLIHPPALSLLLAPSPTTAIANTRNSSMWCRNRSPFSSSSPLSHRPQKQPLFAGERERKQLPPCPMRPDFSAPPLPRFGAAAFLSSIFTPKKPSPRFRAEDRKEDLLFRPEREKRTGYPCRAIPFSTLLAFRFSSH